MVYYLFDYLEKAYQFPGASLFQFLTFRAALAIIVALMISTYYGKTIIKILQQKQLGESVRDLGLDGQLKKAGTPTMGGIIIILATLVPVLLFCKLHNIYIILLIVTTLWMGVIGFTDDYLKILHKNKDGLAGRFKVVGQVGLGLIVGVTMYFHPSITIQEKISTTAVTATQMYETHPQLQQRFTTPHQATKTTIPFFKNNQFDYASLLTWLDPSFEKYSWLIFIPFVIFIITAVSNGANLTDGIDGLAAGSSAIILIALGLFAWISGNMVFSHYLSVMFIPNSGELTVFIAAFAGGLVGFLWYNAFPAQVFMGDTGSLTIGGIIAVIAILIRKELSIPVLCGVFFIETVSVMLQVSWFKYTKKRVGEGRRIFLMAPLHHHFQKQGIHESKIVARFWILGILLAIVTVITLKIR